MNAECARPTCEEPAEVLLAFDPRTARAWLRDLDGGDPSMGLILCTRHAESTSVPISWEIVDERRCVPEFSSQMYDSDPSFDDIFPPRAGYSRWDNLPDEEIHHVSDVPSPDEGSRFAPDLTSLEEEVDGGQNVAFDPSGATRAVEYAAEFEADGGDPTERLGEAPVQRENFASTDGAWYDTKSGDQPGWLGRAASLDFGPEDYYDPYLDDPELGEPIPPIIAEPQSPRSNDDSAVAPLVRPGSPDEQVPATDLIAAASVKPRPLSPRRPRPPVKDPQTYKDAVRLPERADRSQRDVTSPPPPPTDGVSSTDPLAGGPEDLAASGTDGVPFPPHPGARNNADPNS